MEKLFNLCVELLVWLAELTSTTYEEINVIIFIIVGPIIFSLLVMYSIFITYKYKTRKTMHENDILSLKLRNIEL